jgi:hypothetical protein
MKRLVCKNCGVVNEVSEEDIEDNDDWLQCALPTGFEWILPAGKITPIVGDPIYISGTGEHLSHDAYLDKYNIDPEIAYRLMRGKVSTKEVSRIIAKQSQVKAQVSSKMRSQSWLDDDDWTS